MWSRGYDGQKARHAVPLQVSCCFTNVRHAELWLRRSCFGVAAAEYRSDAFMMRDNRGDSLVARTIISIAAGITISKDRISFDRPVAVVRSHAEHGGAGGKSVTAISVGSHAAEIHDEARRILSSIGDVGVLDENATDAVTANFEFRPRIFLF